MKGMKKEPFLSLAAALLWLAGSATMQAQRFRTLSEPAYQEMRRLAQRLDERTQHTNDQAQREDYAPYRRDTGLRQAVSDFARRASRFDERMANYRAEPWQVDDELRNLLRIARDVQNQVRRSRYLDEHTVADWDDTVDVLNRMIRLYEADVHGSGHYEYGAPREGPEYRGGGYGQGRPPRAYGYSQDRLVILSRELADRATRSHDLAERLSAGRDPRLHRFFEAIHNFDDRARDFQQRIESGQADPRTIREDAQQLLEDARLADREMRRKRAFPEVWDEWRGAIRVLERILDLVRA